MVEDGYGDFCFDVGESEIYFVENIISSCNEEMRRLINKSTNNRIKIKDPLITNDSIINLLIYYGNGTIEISEDNVVDMFYTCLIFKENVLKLYIESFIKQHCNIKIMKQLLDILYSVDSIELINVNNMALDYLQMNGYKLLSDNEIDDLSISSISYVLHIPNLIIKSENYLLKKLITHYNNSKKQLERFDLISYSSSSPSKRNRSGGLNEKYKSLFDLLNWEKISLTEFSKNEIEVIKNLLKEIEESKNKRSNEVLKVKRIYVDPIRSGNEKFDDYLLKYIKLYNIETTVINVSDDEKYDILSINNLNEIISTILMENNHSSVVYQIICLVIISDLNLNIKLNVSTRTYLLSSLIYEFQQMNNKNKIVNINIIKAIIMCINDNNDLVTLYRSCGINIFTVIINFNQPSPPQRLIEMIIKFLQQNLKNNHLEYETLMKSLINEDIKDQFEISNQLEFKYPNKTYTFYEGDSFEIIPQFSYMKSFNIDSNTNLFTVTPKFPSFITLNPSNGRIKGLNTKRLPETKFIVKYESKSPQYSKQNITTEIILSIESIRFENCDNMLKVDENGRILSYDNNGLISFRGMNEKLRSEVNLKIKNGTYHIKYLLKDIKNVIFGICDKRNENMETTIEYNQFENKRKNFLISPSKLRNSSEKVLLEVIISMDNRLLSYKHRDKIESLKFNSKSSQLIPLIYLNEMDLSPSSSIEILSVCKDD